MPGQYCDARRQAAWCAAITQSHITSVLGKYASAAALVVAMQTPDMQEDSDRLPLSGQVREVSLVPTLNTMRDLATLTASGSNRSLSYLATAERD